MKENGKKGGRGRGEGEVVLFLFFSFYYYFFFFFFFALLSLFAGREVNVSIVGERGEGKESEKERVDMKD